MFFQAIKLNDIPQPRATTTTKTDKTCLGAKCGSAPKQISARALIAKERAREGERNGPRGGCCCSRQDESSVNFPSSTSHLAGRADHLLAAWNVGRKSPLEWGAVMLRNVKELSWAELSERRRAFGIDFLKLLASGQPLPRPHAPQTPNFKRPNQSSGRRARREDEKGRIAPWQRRLGVVQLRANKQSPDCWPRLRSPKRHRPDKQLATLVGLLVSSLVSLLV